MYDLIVEYVETRDPALLELAAREALRSGAYLEHVLDLILLTPAEELPPSARRLAAGVKHVVKSADCGALPPRLAVPCEIAKGAGPCKSKGGGARARGAGGREGDLRILQGGRRRVAVKPRRVSA